MDSFVIGFELSRSHSRFTPGENEDDICHCGFGLCLKGDGACLGSAAWEFVVRRGMIDINTSSRADYLYFSQTRRILGHGPGAVTTAKLKWHRLPMYA